MESLFVSEKYKNGFTLIELILASVLISVILGVIMALLVNNTKMFDKTELKAQLQNEARALENYITNEVKYASNVYVMSFDDLPSGVATSYYIYINKNDNGIYYVEKGDTFNKNAVDDYGVFMGSLEDMKYELEFNLIEKTTATGTEYDKTAFHYRIKALYRNDDFEIDSVLNLSNTTDKGFTNIVAPFKVDASDNNKPIVPGDAISFDFDKKVTGLGSYILYANNNFDEYGTLVGKNKKKLEKDVMGRFSGNNIDLWIEFEQEYEASLEASGNTDDLFKDLYPSYEFVGDVIDVRWPNSDEYDYTNSSFNPVEYDVKGSDGFINTYYVRAYRVDKYSYEKIQNDCGITKYSFLKDKNNGISIDYTKEVEEDLAPIGVDASGNEIYEIIVEGEGGLPIRPRVGQLPIEFELIPDIEFVGAIIGYRQPGDFEDDTMYNIYSETEPVDLMKSTIKDHYPDKPTIYVVQSLDGQVKKIYYIYYRVNEQETGGFNGFIDETGPIFYKMVIEQPENNKIVSLNDSVDLKLNKVFARRNNKVEPRTIQGYYELPSDDNTFEVMLIMKMEGDSGNYKGYDDLEYTAPQDAFVLEDGSTTSSNLLERRHGAIKGFNSPNSVVISGANSGEDTLISMEQSSNSLGFSVTSSIETNVSYQKMGYYENQGLLGMMLVPHSNTTQNGSTIVLSAYTIPNTNYWPQNRYPLLKAGHTTYFNRFNMDGWTFVPDANYDSVPGESKTGFSNKYVTRDVFFSIYCEDNYYIATYHYANKGDEILNGPLYNLIDSYFVTLDDNLVNLWNSDGYDLMYTYKGIPNIGVGSNAVSFSADSNYFYHIE